MAAKMAESCGEDGPKLGRWKEGRGKEGGKGARGQGEGGRAKGEGGRGEGVESEKRAGNLKKGTDKRAGNLTKGTGNFTFIKIIMLLRQAASPRILF